jgi:hypothetical protein
MPQMPQLATSVATFTQLEPQAVVPAMHTQPALTQLEPGWQALPQPPQ